MKPRAIEVQIEELVLHGFSARERHAIADALQRELTLLLETRGLPGKAQISREHEALRLPHVTLSSAPRAEQAGAALAGAIYGGLRA